MRKLTIKVLGESPLVMGNVDNAFDYQSPIFKELTRLYKKGKNTTDADRERIAYLSWINGIYQKDNKIVVPGKYIRGGLRQAATPEKMGKTVSRAVVSVEDANLVIPGSFTIDKMSKDGKFYWTRPVKRGVVVTNPKFPDYSFTTSVVFDERVIDEDVLIRFLGGMRLGSGIAMGYGRIKVEVLKSETT